MRRRSCIALAGARGLAAAALVSLVAGAAAAREVSVPMQLDYGLVRQQMVADVFDGPGESTPVLQDDGGCNQIVLAHPKISGRDGLLRVAADFEATLGIGFAGWCLPLSLRKGVLDAGLEPRLDPKRPIIEFRVVASDLYNEAGVRGFTGFFWDWVRSQVHPRLETLRFDLDRPLTELRAFVPALFPEIDRAEVRHLIDSVSLADVAIAEAITVRVRLDAPQTAPVVEQESQAPLTEAELARWDAAWQGWDAFLTFLIKHSLREGGDQVRAELRSVLLDARYDIARILQSSEGRPADPVRPLFLATWQKLAPILRQLTPQLPGEAALHYLSLIAAADLVQAIDQLGPGYGVELSTNGLRRMARMIEPLGSSDPIEYRESVDTELRELLGFGAPLELPAQSEELPPTAPIPSEPPAEPPAPGSSLDRPVPLAISLVAVVAQRSLERWLPTLDEVGEYLPRVGEMLGAAALRTQHDKALADRYATLFRRLVLTTAWQESCWRQFVSKGGKPQPLTSSVGAIGIMQVNVRVWRGFYDVTSLRNSPQYNAEAGSEILHHYLTEYAIPRREDAVRDQLDDLARATYSAYNAGPRRLDRYRRTRAGKIGHRIDADFWAKYQQIRDGNELAVRSCFPGLAT